MKAIHLQNSLAFIFISLGAWCLLLPNRVEFLVFKPEFYIGNDTSALLVGCFGAQAILTGILALTSRFTAKTFLYFGLIGSIPFFGFNYYFYIHQSMFTNWMILDFFGNAGILACAILGYRLARQESKVKQKLQRTSR